MQAPSLAVIGAHVDAELLKLLDRLWPEHSPDPAVIHQPALAGFHSGRRDMVRILHQAKAAYEESLKSPQDAPAAPTEEEGDEGLPPLRLA